MTDLVQGVYTDAEIIARIIDAAEPVSGPSGYPLTIKYTADNSTEPPVIYVDFYEGDHNCLFDMYVDQNTTLSDFNYLIKRMRNVAELCAKAHQNKTTFQEEWQKMKAAKDESEEELPF